MLFKNMLFAVIFFQLVTDGFETTLLVGNDDAHLKLIEQSYNIKINIRGDEIIIEECDETTFNEIIFETNITHILFTILFLKTLWYNFKTLLKT